MEISLKFNNLVKKPLRNSENPDALSSVHESFESQLMKIFWKTVKTSVVQFLEPCVPVLPLPSR